MNPMIFCVNGWGAPIVSVLNSDKQYTKSRTLDFSQIIQKATTSGCAVISHCIVAGSVLNKICAHLISRAVVLNGSCSCVCMENATVPTTIVASGGEATEGDGTRGCVV
eukprot:scaffold164296_cov47-Attheya_sp.AAC.2